MQPAVSPSVVLSPLIYVVANTTTGPETNVGRSYQHVNIIQLQTEIVDDLLHIVGGQDQRWGDEKLLLHPGPAWHGWKEIL